MRCLTTPAVGAQYWTEDSSYKYFLVTNPLPTPLGTSGSMVATYAASQPVSTGTCAGKEGVLLSVSEFDELKGGGDVNNVVFAVLMVIFILGVMAGMKMADLTSTLRGVS